MDGRLWFTLAGAASAAAALAHLAVIVWGPAGYRALGAGERLARAAERGEAWPALATVGIAAVLGGWAAYAWSGAALIRPLPLLRPVLLLVTLVLLARGAALVWPGLLRRPDLSPGFVAWSSAVVLGIGLLYALGLVLGWSRLKGVA